MKGGPSLVDYIAENGIRLSRKCAVCLFAEEHPDLYAQLIEGWEKGAREAVVLRWLTARGITDLTQGQLGAHFRSGGGHHVRSQEKSRR